MDHNKLVDMYYTRNIQMNINNNNTIIKAIEKLGYNININKRPKHLISNYSRIKFLSVFLQDTDTLEFYNNLTIEELEYLGY